MCSIHLAAAAAEVNALPTASSQLVVNSDLDVCPPESGVNSADTTSDCSFDPVIASCNGLELKPVVWLHRMDVVGSMLQVKSSSHFDLGAINGNHENTKGTAMNQATNNVDEHALFLSEINRHQNVHENSQRAFQCIVCEKVFARERSLNLHLCSAHGYKPRLCFTCGKEFSRADRLRKHLKTHATVAVSSLSSSGVSSQLGIAIKQEPLTHELQPMSQISNNMTDVIATKLPPAAVEATGNSTRRHHRCAMCGLRFRRPSQLKKHMSVHSDERKFECRYCGTKVKTNASLKRHVAVLHGPGKKPFQCVKCRRKFAYKKSLEQHVQVCKVATPLGDIAALAGPSGTRSVTLDGSHGGHLPLSTAAPSSTTSRGKLIVQCSSSKKRRQSFDDSPINQPPKRKSSHPCNTSLSSLSHHQLLKSEARCLTEPSRNRSKARRHSAANEPSISHAANHTLPSPNVSIHSEVNNDVNAKTPLKGPRSTDDEHDLFGRLVAHLMRELPPGEASDLCRIRIQQVIIEAKYAVAAVSRLSSS